MSAVSMSLLDICLSDYFQGCSPNRGIVLAVPVFKEMNRQELIDSLVDEWISDATEDVRFNDVTEVNVRAAAEELTKTTDPAKGLFPHAPSRDGDEDESDSPYVYILVHPPEDA